MHEQFVILLILLLVLLIIMYYELRVSTSKLPKDVFRYFHFESKKFMGKDVFIISPEEEKSDKLILYIHGGSYVGELEKYHWTFFKDIINATNATLIVPDYPLTPENTYLQVFKMMEPLYKEIINNLEGKEFILMGDSAGAGLALALYQRNGKLKRKLPNRTILISPWLDVRMTNPDIDKINDPVLKKPLLKISGKRYAGKKWIKKLSC